MTKTDGRSAERGVRSPQPLIKIRDLCKSFNGVPALSGVSLDIRPGEVHGLLGANGSGKSTLIKILAGVYNADGGVVTIRGDEVSAPFGSRGLRDHGLGFVHQDLGLVSESTVLEHMALDSSGSSWPWRRVDWASERKRVTELLNRFEIDIDPNATVDVLTPVQRAMVAIVRAVGAQEAAAGQGQILVLDEPTVFLPRHEVDVLFKVIDRLREQGDAVLLVSHDLDEIVQITDRVTVFRNGELAGTRETADVNREDLVQLILGTRDQQAIKTHVSAHKDATPVMSVTGLRGAQMRDLDLELYAGEVVGVTGLAGSGFEELPDVLFGAQPAVAGTIEYDGRRVPNPTPAQSMRDGVVLIPANRKEHGGSLEMSVLENMSLPFLTRRARGFRVDWAVMASQAQQTCERLQVKPADPEALFGHLSGGNQQKVLIGKWMDTEPSVLLLNEPTQGVDIGARREIFKLVRAATAQGMAVLCATSDYEQLVEMADRVVVLDRGRTRHELHGEHITKDALASAVYGEEVE